MHNEPSIHSASISFPDIGNSLDCVLKNDSKFNQRLLDRKMVHEAYLCALMGWKRHYQNVESVYKNGAQLKEITNRYYHIKRMKCYGLAQ